jgi:hypothetical protein
VSVSNTAVTVNHWRYLSVTLVIIIKFKAQVPWSVSAQLSFHLILCLASPLFLLPLQPRMHFGNLWSSVLFTCCNYYLSVFPKLIYIFPTQFRNTNLKKSVTKLDACSIFIYNISPLWRIWSVIPRNKIHR